jgi:hypothetical protein
MSAIGRIGQRVLEVFKPAKKEVLNLTQQSTQIPSQSEFEKAATSPKARLSNLIVRNRIYMTVQGQEDLWQAIQMAKSSFPNRTQLYVIYEEAMRDFHLRSQIRTAIIKSIKEPWAIVKYSTNDIDQDLTRLMQKQPILDAMYYHGESEFWGHTLMELGYLVKDENEKGFVLKSIDRFERQNVKPEQGILTLFPGTTTGIPFREPPYDTFIIEAGDPYDLGLLEIAARYSIYKKFTYGDWSNSSERWADPLLAWETDSSDDVENQKKIDFGRNFGKDGFVLIPSGDKVTMLERKSGDSHKIYKEAIETLNDENSKGINGQSATADNQAYAGTADVQEGILEDFTDYRIRKLTCWMNDVLIPKLISLGEGTAYAQLKGYEYKPIRFMKELKPPIDPNDPNNQPVDPNADPKNPKGGNAPKKRFP